MTTTTFTCAGCNAVVTGLDVESVSLDGWALDVTEMRYYCPSCAPSQHQAVALGVSVYGADALEPVPGDGVVGDTEPDGDAVFEQDFTS